MTRFVEFNDVGVSLSMQSSISAFWYKSIENKWFYTSKPTRMIKHPNKKLCFKFNIGLIVWGTFEYYFPSYKGYTGMI